MYWIVVIKPGNKTMTEHDGQQEAAGAFLDATASGMDTKKVVLTTDQRIAQELYEGSSCGH